MTATSIGPTPAGTETPVAQATVRDTLTMAHADAELLRNLTVHERHRGRPDLTKGGVVGLALALYAAQVCERDGLEEIPDRGDYSLRPGHGRRS